jgi:hypothetical protein
MNKILTKRIRSLLTNYKIISLFLTTILISGFIIFQPLQINAQNKTVTIIPDKNKVTKCKFVTPLTDPIDMNTVIFKDIAKTIHVEKEVFKCKTKNGALVIAMVSLFTELFESMRTQSTLNKTVETVTCVKGYNGTVSYCDSENSYFKSISFCS